MLIKYILILSFVLFGFNACSNKHKNMKQTKHRTQMQIEKEKESFKQLDNELKKYQ